MDKTYDPSAIESRWYRTWEDKGWFSPTGTGDPFCIMIPPPTATTPVSPPRWWSSASFRKKD
jgi:valyl-tRNA synthetase